MNRLGLPLVFILTAAVGCSRITVSQELAADADLSGLRTYSWHEGLTRRSADPRFDAIGLDSQIRSAIDSALADHGFEKAAAGTDPDFLVAYHTSIKTKSVATAVNEPSGYATGWGAHREDEGYRSIDSGGTYFEEWEQGRLVVDLLTPESDQPLWRGIAKTEIEFDNPPSARERRLRDAAERLIGQLHPPR